MANIPKFAKTRNVDPYLKVETIDESGTDS
jgi:hypothetical protein